MNRSSILPALILLSATIASADPKRTVSISGVSPFEGCVADLPSGQPGTTFVGSEVEPWVAVDPIDANHMIASWQQDR